MDKGCLSTILLLSIEFEFVDNFLIIIDRQFNNVGEIEVKNLKIVASYPMNTSSCKLDVQFEN